MCAYFSFIYVYFYNDVSGWFTLSSIKMIDWLIHTYFGPILAVSYKYDNTLIYLLFIIDYNTCLFIVSDTSY